ncbi:xylulokinase [Thioclava sp. SK-1]|uniref:xylulokinase n=1 Tax=Thioclava sp. SK-1 TaxID=1889770 RepID=UPI00082507D7|nr:xylulokinase [Thioclava sp. SK-1]OCX66607.1 xylulokinase [Thioclava sp. SK-1]
MYLGIDLGTSGLRALLMDEGGTAIGAAEAHYTVSNPAPGWSEQDPAQWITALETAVTALRNAHPAFSALKGVGISGHMHGATVLDQAGDVLRPCILWNDTRSHIQAAELDAQPRFRELSANIVFPGFTAPKLAWIRQHEPEVFAKIAKVLLPAAYLGYYLTGEYVADMSDSAGTSWLDTGARDWSDELLSATGLRREQMPRLIEGCQAAAALRPEVATRWGVADSVVVAGGAGDNAAAAVGIGAMNEGEGFVSLGTSGVLLAARGGFAPAPETALHTFCHAVPGRWYQMGVMLSATDSLNWLARITGQTPAQLTRALPQLQAPGRERFLPYLSGERTPHNDAQIRGSFTGLGTDTTVDHMTRAVLAGVAYGLRDSAEALRATGAELGQLLAIGGGTGSKLWVEMIATVLNCPLALPKDGEFGAALGAARLGLIAATKADANTVLTPPELGEVIAPNTALHAAFDDEYHAFKAAYPAIRAIQ